MKKAMIPLYVAGLLALVAPRAHADIDLYDLALSTSTGITADWEDLTAVDPTTLVSTSMACCGDPSGSTPGIGSLSYTFNPGAAGSYVVSLYFDYDAATPNFNEYGAVNSGGSAQAGISYEIFNANSASSNIALFGSLGAPLGEVYGNADGLNHVPGTTSNYLNSCVGASCNADVGMALTYSFTLAAGQEAILSAVSSTTNPGGFSLETLHPVDANNNATADVYLTGSFVIQGGGPPPPVPEPSAWILLGTVVAFLSVWGARRKANV